ncbi:hypothetical protein SO802_031598 [Lithocarpus litseifolius]|uniref:B-like cyclin n=1 Tax=Lithocarpus litseifolius TaxID=425828 RepID=A0AAW2BNA6_9ROSI
MALMKQLKLPYESMAVISSKKVVLFHRFYYKKSIARFNVKKVAASSVWLASKLEESPMKARHVLIVFHKMECKMENLPIEHLEIGSQVKHPLLFHEITSILVCKDGDSSTFSSQSRDSQSQPVLKFYKNFCKLGRVESL